MEQKNLKPKEIIYGLLVVAIMFLGYASIEFGNLVLGSIAIGIVLVVVFYEIYKMPKETMEKIQESEEKSISLKLIKYFEISLLLFIVGYVVWHFVFKST